MILDRSKDIGPYVPEEDDDLIICRCEEVTKGEIRRAIHDGMWTITELRRYLRTGMGLCQGKTCGRNVKSILAKELGVHPSKIADATARGPARPVDMSVLGNEVECNE